MSEEDSLPRRISKRTSKYAGPKKYNCGNKECYKCNPTPKIKEPRKPWRCIFGFHDYHFRYGTFRYVIYTCRFCKEERVS